jgi:hypothetical protein
MAASLRAALKTQRSSTPFVVPAKAGTHNHRIPVADTILAPASHNEDKGGYGSRLALALLAWPGRRRIASSLSLLAMTK